MLSENNQLLTDREWNDVNRFDGKKTDAQIKTKNETPIERSTQVIYDVENFHRLHHLWNSLNSGLDSPMQDFSWFQSCLETVCADDDLHIVMHRMREKSGESAAIAPLVRQKGLLPVMRMLGVGRIYEPIDFLYTDIAALDALAVALRKLGNPLCLEHLLADSQVIPALQKAYERRGWIRIDAMNDCPYIPLHEGWTEPEQQFNSGRRSDLRRAQRHAERLGTVTYEILSPAPAEVESLLTEAYQVEAQSWKGRAGTDLITDQPLGDFYRHLALKASERGALRLCFLRINGEAIAVQIAVEHAARFWLLKIGYNEQYSKCSAGNLLMLHTVKYAAQKGLKSYEFLGSAEAWTKVWTEWVRPCVKVRVYPFNVKGCLYFVTDAAQFAWKRLNQLFGKNH